MTKNYTLLSLLCFVLMTIQLKAQVSFSNANDRFVNSDFHSGVAIAVVDMNADGLDDIVRLSQGRSLEIEYQNSGVGQFTNFVFGAISDQSQWSICVADVDNDGYNDVLTGGRYDDIKYVKAMQEGTAFEMSDLPGPSMFIQGSNLVDINNDGYIDFFACNDDAESRIWSNDGTGNFVAADEWINMATVPSSDNSGNYGSIWTDFDNDGDLDLYIAKCRQGVGDSTDPRRINALFVNTGGGVFVEAAENYNLKIGAQSWTADFQDIDNDGDMDCFITNHDVPSMLLENDGAGVFTDITEGSGINIGGLPIQGVMRDFDNDGYVDILVAGSRNYLFHNNGDKSFTEVTGLFNNEDMESFALGDLNHDGFIDIYGGYGQVYTTPSNIDDVLWLNNGESQNNFLTINLIGQQSNRNGIGARINIYYDEAGIQTREVRAGESYGIMNTLSQHFGLGTHSLIDSMVIKWPSGTVDRFLNLDANQFLTIIEGNCISPQVSIEVEGTTTICSGETVTLTAPEGFNYTWSNGESSQAIQVGEEGSYNVTVTDESACFGISTSITVIVDPDETPSLSALGDIEFCAGGSVLLEASEASNYSWSNGANTQIAEITESGEYTVTTQGLCAAFTSAPISVHVLASDAPGIDIATYADGQAELAVTGNNIYWYESPDATESFAQGNTLVTPVAGDTTFYAQNHEVYPGPVSASGMLEHAGNNYSGNQYNGAVIFDCFSPFTLRTVTVYTDQAGTRIIELTTAAGDVLQSREVEVAVGTQIINLNFDVEPGLGLWLTTNEASNQTNFGYASPRFQRASENVNYPYVVDEVLSINDSNLGSDRYYYFFNWEVKEQDVVCISPFTEVSLTVVDTKEPFTYTQLSLAPNPTSSKIDLQLPVLSGTELPLQILNATGQVVKTVSLQQAVSHQEIDLSELASGMYWLRLQDGRTTYAAKVIKQ
ncbi:MAG: hypothetical protein DHS20C18_14770 [Saprospiraceae bacterium]|nr:MAG: hypothetical protein DHS20C18_14770 [Saprospiraceae bacterium]